MFIGKYEVVSEIGEGGMGKVVLAKNQSGRLVVIKQPFADNPEFREMLVNEARVGLRLRHPHIVETVDFFELDGQVSLVLSYVSGASLKAIRDHGPVPAGIVCLWGQQIAEALEAIHNATSEEGVPLNIVHRDVTPGNIMVGHDGNVRLIDLGIARSDDRNLEQTKTGYLRGTLRYLAPEVFKLGEYSPQSDMWSLGISLLDAALGRSAIEGREAEVYAKVMDGRIFGFQSGEFLDPLLERALRKLLAQDPADRPKKAKDVAALFSMIGQDLKGSPALASQEVQARVGESALPLTSDALIEESRDELVEQAAGAWGGSTAWSEADAEVALAEEAAAKKDAQQNDVDRKEIFNRGEIQDSVNKRAGSLADSADAVIDAGGFLAKKALHETNEKAANASTRLRATAELVEEPDHASDGLRGGTHRNGTNSGPTSAELNAFNAPPIGGGQTQLRNYKSDIRSMEQGSGRKNTGKSMKSDEDEDAFPVILTAVVAGGLVLFTLLVFGIVLLVSNLKGADDPVITSVIGDAGNGAPELEPFTAEPPAPEGKPEKPDEEEVQREKDRLAEERRIRKIRASMPSCWQPGITKYFFYVHRGKTVIKQRFKDIPRRFKKKVKCVN
ncbi:MAG: protein kinase [Deltaproteobacteria bacterium]|nr:protein kinase [Deltaproteobacteria bacterium]